MTLSQEAQAPFIAFWDRLFCLYKRSSPVDKMSGSGYDQSLTNIHSFIVFCDRQAHLLSPIEQAFDNPYINHHKDSQNNAQRACHESYRVVEGCKSS